MSGSKCVRETDLHSKVAQRADLHSCQEDHSQVEEQMFHVEEHRQDQAEHNLHEEHGQDQVTVEEMKKFNNCEQVHEHIQVPAHEDKIGGGEVVHGKGNVNKPSDSDSHGRKAGLSGTVGSVGMRWRIRREWDDQERRRVG